MDFVSMAKVLLLMMTMMINDVIIIRFILFVFDRKILINKTKMIMIVISIRHCHRRDDLFIFISFLPQTRSKP